MAVETSVCIGLIVRPLEGCLHVLERLNAKRRIYQAMVDGVVLQISDGVVHKVLTVLTQFNGMARGAVLGSYYNMDLVAIVLKGVLMFFRIHSVALGTAYDHTSQFAGYLLK
jgi:hypothetical protein